MNIPLPAADTDAALAATVPSAATSRPTIPSVARLSAVPNSVILQPTTLCNLDCRYCYLPFRKTNHLMSLPVAQSTATSVNRWAAARPGFEVVWHGGEPLAAGRDYLAALMNPFEGVTHSLQTNATLIDDAWCRFFQDHRMRVGVSIDGTEVMNAERVTRSGSPAFDRIMRGIGRLRHHRIPFSVIAVVTDPSPDVAQELYGFLADLGSDVAGINIEEQEGTNTRSSERDTETVTAFWEAMADAWRHDGRMRVRELDRVLSFADAVLAGERPDGAERLDPLPTVAYDGSVVLISPELAGFDDARFGTLATGNVLQVSLEVLLAEAANRTAWLPEFLAGVDDCRATCPYYAFCGGGHPANKYFEHGGRLDGTRTRYCTGSKIALVEGVMRHAHAH
ncbi:cyclophane-forming radical SAM peptide maturase AmcB [Yinghuangia soli]|uniref:Radical SAM protein n=1 Tax=Yinghuangia soli TaxID=2908204 RepID=A0AA41Q6K4_9ACTN|nr:cyclophane-forming radical SAM peptide maturase AmcB [Yinghuangia soli]MCF2532504.1 radical SAM protein [Yinghuangia soli]